MLMKNGKFLGYDGLPHEFYKSMWDCIVEELFCLASEVFTSSYLSKTPNQGLFKIIPKNGAYDFIGGWCPITLLFVA